MINDLNFVEEILLDPQFASEEWSEELRGGGLLNPKKMYVVLRQMEKVNKVKL